MDTKARCRSKTDGCRSFYWCLKKRRMSLGYNFILLQKLRKEAEHYQHYPGKIQYDTVVKM